MPDGPRPARDDARRAAARDDARVLSAIELYDRGHAAVLAGRHAGGKRWLTQALDRTSRPDLRARIVLTLAYSASERGSTDDGLAMLDTIDDHGLSREVQGLLDSQRGLLLMRGGDSDRALEAFDLALSRLDGETLHRARALLNRGNVHVQRHDLGRARDDFTACAEVARLGEHTRVGAFAGHNLGYVELLAGRLPEALQAMDAARPTIAAQESAVAEAVADTDRAQVMVAAGLTTEADATLGRAAESFGRLRLRQSQAETELARAALLLVTGRPADAMHLARAAATRFRRRGATAWALRADGLVLGASVQSGRVSADAVATGSALDAALRAEGLHEEARTVRLRTLRAAHALGDAAAVDRLLPAAQVPPSAPITTRMLGRIVRADVCLDRGRRADAARHLRAGLGDLFAWQSSFGSLDLQTGVAGHGRALAVRGLRLALDDGRPAIVHEWGERARAFASRVPAVRPPADPEAAGALARLRQLRAEAGPAPGPASRREMAALERQIRDRSLYSPGPGIVTEPLPLDDVQARLSAAGGTLVTHLVVDHALHALVVTGHDARVVRLGAAAELSAGLERVRRDLDTASTYLAGAIRSAVASSLVAGLDNLAGLLWSPLAPNGGTGDGPLLLVPSAALAAVPWSVLPGPARRPLTVARTATAWALNRAGGSPVRRVGLVAGPDVARGEEEVRRAAAAWGRPRVLTGPAATAPAVTALAAEVDLLHFAAHGTHARDNPLFSALDLADGPWFGHDVTQVAPVPAHVVLSACELGGSSVRSGEEVLGMTAAWEHAGARTVIASPVRVRDDAACEVLAAHHTAVAGGAPVAAALATALATLPADAAPAPFVCFGAGW